LCDIIVLNVHAPTEDKCDDTKDSFHEELQRAFHKWLPHEYFVRRFHCKRGEGILQPSIGNELVMTMGLE
jgi:hypothetical protein